MNAVETEMMHNLLVQNQKKGDRKPLFSLPSFTGNLNFGFKGYIR